MSDELKEAEARLEFYRSNEWNDFIKSELDSIIDAIKQRLLYDATDQTEIGFLRGRLFELENLAALEERWAARVDELKQGGNNGVDLDAAYRYSYDQDY